MSGWPLILRSMLAVTVICSNPDCWEEREVLVEDFEQLDEAACDCNYGFVVVRVAELRAA